MMATNSRTSPSHTNTLSMPRSSSRGGRTASSRGLVASRTTETSGRIACTASPNSATFMWPTFAIEMTRSKSSTRSRSTASSAVDTRSIEGVNLRSRSRNSEYSISEIVPSSMNV